MAYRKVAMIEIKEILLRISKGQTKRTIRRDLGMHGITLNKYLDATTSLGIDPETIDPGSITDKLCYAIKTAAGPVKDKIAPRDKILLPHKDKIEAYLKKGLTKTKIISLLGRQGIAVSEAGFYRFLKDHLSSYMGKGITVRLPECQPGQYAQADFGRMGKIWDTKAKRKRFAWAFIVTLAYSRLMFVYLTFKQDHRAVIEGCEAAWKYFGGITDIVIFDNLKPVVDKSDRYSPKINKVFLEYAQYRGFIIDPANSGHAKGKPIVERMVPYVRKNFFAGENFISLDDCQERAIDWCNNVAGARIHGTTRRVPLEVFEAEEKGILRAYDSKRYDTPYLAYPKVHPDHHIAFRKSLYSLPTKYIGKKVEVKGDSALVRVYFNDVLIKTHPKIEEGKRSTDFNDYPKEITPYTLRNPRYQIDQGKKMHPLIGDYIEFMLSGPYPWHRIRSVQHLLRIGQKYGPDRTASACKKAKAYSIYDIRRIEKMLKNGVEEDNDIASEPYPSFEGGLKFLRSNDSFINYK